MSKLEEALCKKLEEKLGKGSKSWLDDHLVILAPKREEYIDETKS
jgi:hypothetical protein